MPAKKEALKVEQFFEVSAVVTTEKTAKAMGSGDLPVFATPAMVALMENAAMQCVASLLPEGITTVGTKMELTHDRASAVGAVITARATLVQQTERSFTFTVEAFDSGVRIGGGTHTRATVKAASFMAKLQG